MVKDWNSIVFIVNISCISYTRTVKTALFIKVSGLSCNYLK